MTARTKNSYYLAAARATTTTVPIHWLKAIS